MRISAIRSDFKFGSSDAAASSLPPKVFGTSLARAADFLQKAWAVRRIIIPRSLVQIQFPLPNKSNDIIGLGFKRRSPDRLFPFPGISGVSATFRGFPGLTGVSMQQECSKRRLRAGEFRVVLLRRCEGVAVGVGGHLHGAIAHPQELSRFQAARMLAMKRSSSSRSLALSAERVCAEFCTSLEADPV